MNRPIQIALQDATVAFNQDGKVRSVLRDIDIQIPQGQAVGLVGRNGSGKSTLLRVIAGLLPLSRGTISRFDDSHIPVVFQNPDAQIVGQTVIEDICFGLENMAVPSEEMEERARAALLSVGLGGYEKMPVERLSGGQKQLLCIASALAMQPSVIVLDEPTAMLDPGSKKRVMLIMEKLIQEGKTVIWATQAMEELALAERIIALDEGRIVYDDTPVQFFYGTDKNIPCCKLGFQLPYGIELIHELRRSGLPTGANPVREEDCLEVVSLLCR